MFITQCIIINKIQIILINNFIRKNYLLNNKFSKLIQVMELTIVKNLKMIDRTLNLVGQMIRKILNQLLIVKLINL
jgi:hypothetical protein